MIKMLLTGKAKIVALFLGSIALTVAGSANSITFHQLKFRASLMGCVTLTVSPTGEITCNTGTAASNQYNNSSKYELMCPEGIAINTETRVFDCATTTPHCTLSAVASAPVIAESSAPTWVEPGNEVTLTAHCSNAAAATYHWTSAVGLVPSSSNTTRVKVPTDAAPGVYAYSVSASNADGAGNVASALVKVGSKNQKGPFAYIAHQDKALPTSSSPLPPGTLSIIDTSNGLVANPVEVGTSPRGVAVNAAGTRVYVSSQDNTVSVINTANNSVIKTIRLKPRTLAASQIAASPMGVAINQRGNRVFVANSGSGTVSVIDTAANEELFQLNVNTKPHGLAVNQEDSHVYVANYGSHTISVIDAKATSSASVPEHVGKGQCASPYGIAVAGDRVFVTCSTAATVSVFKGASIGKLDFEKSVQVGKEPKGIDVSPDGKKVYVANFSDRTVSVIDEQTLDVTNTVPVDIFPEAVSFNPTGTLAYVTKHSGTDTEVANRTVSVIDVATDSVISDPVITVLGGVPWVTGKFVGSNAINHGLWWNDKESGWGISVTRHGNMMFNVIYTYDENKQPTWYVMSDCPVINNTCTGKIYRVTGGEPPDQEWTGANKVPHEAGSGTLTFTDADNGTFKFKIPLDSAEKTKLITRQLFSTSVLDTYTDLWWNDGEAGWGVALTQQGDIIFATWFTYDTDKNPIWRVASKCSVEADGKGCTGEVYQVTGGTSLTSVWSGTSIVPDPVGTVKFTFADASQGEMIYTPKNGVSSKPKTIIRQDF